MELRSHEGIRLRPPARGRAEPLSLAGTAESYQAEHILNKMNRIPGGPDQFWTFSSVRRLTSLLQPGSVCAVGSSGRLSP